MCKEENYPLWELRNPFTSREQKWKPNPNFYSFSEYVKGLRRKYAVINSNQHCRMGSWPIKRALQVWMTWMEKKKSKQMLCEHFHLPFISFKSVP